MQDKDKITLVEEMGWIMISKSINERKQYFNENIMTIKMNRCLTIRLLVIFQSRDDLFVTSKHIRHYRIVTHVCFLDM